MKQTLIIYLHADDLAHPTWVCDGTSHHDDVSELKRASQSRQVIVVVPAEEVLLLHPVLPKMSRRQQLQALPYAIEDQLCDEIENLQFVAGDHQRDGTIPVAVFSKDSMAQWLSLLKSWGITPHQMLPLTLALPYEENTWHVFQNHLWVVRTGPYSGFVKDVSYQDVTQAFSQLRIERPPHLQCHQEVATLNVSDFSPLNLLKVGKVRQITAILPGVMSFKLPVYLALASLLLWLCHPVVSYVILKPKANAIQHEMQVIVNQHLEEEANSTSAVKLNEQWQKLLSRTHHHTALGVLGLIGDSILSTQGVTLMAFDFHSGITNITLRAMQAADLSAYEKKLSNNGLHVSEMNQTMLHGRIETTLKVTA